MAVSGQKLDKAGCVADKIHTSGGQAISVFCDMTSEASRIDLIDAALVEFGKVSILVNNAGGGGPQPFEMPLAMFEAAFKQNVFSGFHLSQLRSR